MPRSTSPQPIAARLVPILALLLAPGCAGLAGHVSRDRYTAPGELFSLTLPDLAGGHVEDGMEKAPDGRHVGFVSITNEFGQMRALSYGPVENEVRTRLVDPSTTQDALQALLQDSLTKLHEVSPGASMLHESPLTLDDGSKSLFAVVRIPGGSSLVARDAANPQGRPLDATRALLLVYRSELLFTLQSEDDLAQVANAGAAGSSPMPDEQELQASRDTLSKLYGSMRFP